MSTIEDFQSTTFAAIPHEDLTVAEAWASSPLGDPGIEDGSLSEPAKFDDYPATTATAKPRSRGTNALLIAAVVAGLGMVSGLGLMLIDGAGSNPQKPAVVVPNSSVDAVTPQAPPSAVPPSPVAPPPPAAAPDAGQPPTGGAADAPVVILPAPAAAPADPGAPAVAGAPAEPGTPPPPPSVTVNIPPVLPVPIPVPVPVPVPPQQGGGQQGGGQQGGGNPPIVHGPVECLACHQQPIQQQPIHPPVQQQPVHPPILQHH